MPRHSPSPSLSLSITQPREIGAEHRDVTWEGIFQTRSTLTVSEKRADCVSRWRRSLNEQLVTESISSHGMKQVNSAFWKLLETFMQWRCQMQVDDVRASFSSVAPSTKSARHGGAPEVKYDQI